MDAPSIPQRMRLPAAPNDNTWSEAWFKTLKYTHTFPERFGSLADAQDCMDRFATSHDPKTLSLPEAAWITNPNRRNKQPD